MSIDEAQIRRQVEYAGYFLDLTGDLNKKIVGAAQDLIGHTNALSLAEWRYYESVRKLCCPWLASEATLHKNWTPFREAEAFFDNRVMVLRILGDDFPLELAFGIAAISDLSEAGWAESALYTQGEPGYDPSRDEAFSGLAAAIAALTLGRQLQRMPIASNASESDQAEIRQRLNKNAAEKRNERYRLLHWEFRRYLTGNKVKSIRNAAEVFYKSLPPDQQIYQSVAHAVRNLSEHVYSSGKP